MFSQVEFIIQVMIDLKTHALELKKEKGTDYELSWKRKGVFNSMLIPLYTAFLHF